MDIDRNYPTNKTKVNTTIFIGGLKDLIIPKEEILDLCSSFGEVKSITYVNKEEKNHIFVEYDQVEDCLHAIENLNGYEYKNIYFNVSFNKQKLINKTKPLWLNEGYYASLNSKEQT